MQLDYSLLVCRIHIRIVSRTYCNACSRHRVTGSVDHVDGDLMVIVFVEYVDHSHIFSGYRKLLFADTGERLLRGPVDDCCRYFICTIRQVISVICFVTVYHPLFDRIDGNIRQCIFFDVTRCKRHFTIIVKGDGDRFVLTDVYFSLSDKHVRIMDFICIK